MKALKWEQCDPHYLQSGPYLISKNWMGGDNWTYQAARPGESLRVGTLADCKAACERARIEGEVTQC